MEFKPKTENEIRESQLAPENDYDFEVLEASDEVSKKGNPMIKLSIGLYHGDAMRWRIFDYLLPSMEFKLRHFCDSVGLLAKYEAGTLTAEDCRGRAGRCNIATQQDKDQQYPPKNVVKDYLCRTAKPLSQPSAAPSNRKPDPDDDVPF